MSAQPDALDALSSEIRSIRRHYVVTVAVMIAITLFTAGVIHYALALQQVSARMSALGAEEATLLARSDDLVLALKRKAVEPSAGEETLDLIRSELATAADRLLAIHDEIFALDASTWLGLPTGGEAAAFYLEEPYLIDMRIQATVDGIRRLVVLDRDALADVYRSSYEAGGPLVRRLPVSVGIERALDAFQQQSLKQSTTLGQLQAVLAAVMVALLLADGLLVFRPLILRLRESQDRIRAAQEELDRRAYEDSLTGLANRARFTRDFERALKTAERNGRPVGLLQLDLDGFKGINDTLGHAAGDAVLKAVAERLTEVVRSVDVVARLGGDEYAIICPDFDPDGFGALAARIHAAVSQPVAWGTETLVPRTSVGAAFWPDHGRDPATLVHHADSAMYIAKQSPGRSHLYQTHMAAADARLRRLEECLPAAIARGDIGVAYRPELRLADRRLVGLTALPVWTALGGPVEAAEILEAASRSGRIADLVRTMMETIADDVADQPTAGSARVTLPLPAVAFTGPLVAEVAAASFGGRGVPMARLTVAIPEAALQGRGADRTRAALVALADAGVRIALDDFGRRWGAVADLASLPMDTVRLSPELVRRALTEPRAAALVRGTTALAHGLGLDVVGTGVASLPALSALAGLGCNGAEGDLLAVPAAVGEVLSRVNAFGSEAPQTLGSLAADQELRSAV